MSLGGYPLGAEYDPRAPWNYQEPHRVKCEACDGRGKHWFAYDFIADRETECTETTWNILPETEDEALAGGGHHIRGEVETCDVCDGEGEIEYEPDYEPDYDD